MKKKKSKKSIVWAVIKTILIVLLIVVVSGGIGLLIYVRQLSSELPNIDLLTYDPEQSSQIFDYKGNLITNVYALENRIYVPLENIADIVKKAVIIQEDKRFYEHGALDFRGIARALWVDITTLSLSQGASTITQQLSRLLFLSLEKTAERKLKEAVLAIRLEEKFTKDQILEMYLNQVYLGSGAYGIESAAQVYFNKHASELNLAEAAMLAGVIKAPSAINPFEDLEAAKESQKQVIEKMLLEKAITEEEAEAALSEELQLAEPTSIKDNMGYAIDYVKEIVSEKFGMEMLYTGGLKIYTTIVPELQLAGTKAIDSVMNSAEKDKIFPKGVVDSKGVIQPQVALTAVDANSGAILTMIGGRDYNNTKFNRSVGLKQPGSSFKIFDYTAAIEYGSLYPSSKIVSEPYTVDNWSPHEWTNNYFGELSIRDALSESSNICAVKTALAVGLDRVIYMARKFGITTPLQPYPSAAIGTFEVKQLEMANAYATLGNGGIYHEPYIITKIISSDGRVLFEHTDMSYRAVSEQTAYIMNKIFSYVMLSKGNARIKELPSAAKTGSTDNWTDAWFEGYTPNISVNIWLGPDSQEVTFPDVFNSGSRFPAMMWRQFMLEAMKIFPKDDFKRPSTGLVSRSAYDSSGYLSEKPSDGKSIVKYDFHETFVPPLDIKEAGFVTVVVCKDSGLLAPPACPDYLKEERTYLRGSEPTQYDPRDFTTVPEVPLFDFRTNKDVLIVGESLEMIAIIGDTNNIGNYKVSFYVYDLPVVTLDSPTISNEYRYSLSLSEPGSVALRAVLLDMNGSVLATIERSVRVLSAP